MHPDNKIVSFVVITESYRRFHTHFIQPSATHPRFWQTCLFTIFPKLWIINRGWNIWENREKAGLSKTGWVADGWCHPRAESATFCSPQWICILHFFWPRNTKPNIEQCSEHKLRDFRTPYLTMTKRIREYSQLGDFAEMIQITSAKSPNWEYSRMLLGHR